MFLCSPWMDRAPAQSTDRPGVWRRERWRFLFRSWAFGVGAALLLLWVGWAIFGGCVSPEKPLTQDLLNANQGPSGAHLFGTDSLGRDVFF